MISSFYFSPLKQSGVIFRSRDYAKIDASVTQAGPRGNGFVRFATSSAYL
jgi:hypothetical protein